MKNKLSVIFSGLIVAIAIAMIVVVFLVPKQPKKNESNSFEYSKVYSSDVEMNVGDRIDNFFSVSGKDANVQIIVEDESLLKIEGDSLIALKQGITKVTIKLISLNSQPSCTITVKIKGNKWAEAVAIQNCEIVDGKIMTNSDVFSIGFKFFDVYGQPASYSYSYAFPSGVRVRKGTGEIQIYATNSFSFELFFGENGNSQIIEVIRG